ncbi:MAG: tRNA (adenosine(37)-N6)-threonylcarbamoyltransferase complex ATPase subunit type 1 TsaE [Candidatus Cloacimonadota bacterium]|nr:MAG: tRNA (adenosine(37)-N6)-threonylcarbamoyltransferase complex ATPase subunit type 1 TsaE [Candidatus Cloacimonadota bacterium]
MILSGGIIGGNLKTIQTKNAQDLILFGETFAKENLKIGDKILVTGVMGSGKTTLAQGISNGLGLNVNITSPTFSKLNIYQDKLSFYHFDLYNLQTEEELEELGIYDFMESEDGVSYIEWWDNFPNFFNTPYHLIEIQITNEGRLVSFDTIST